jgi:hypothetical protein
MANERLYQFPSKASPVPADIIYAGDSASSFDEVNITIAQLISAYPNLSGIAGLTLGPNTYPYSNGSSALTAGTITSLAVSLLADSTIGAMQSTLGYTATPTADQFAGWDTNSNLSANNFLSGYTTTVTAAATTTLTVASTFQQFFTGTTTQICKLPVTSTLVLGSSFYIVNNSTGTVTVESSGGNTITAMAAGTTLLVTCILTSGTTAASWNADYNINAPLVLPLSIANGGTGVSSVTIAPPGLSAAAWAGWDANSNMSANNFIESYATTVTAASTTTLTVSSKGQQFFTGTTTQTVLMPVTSTLVLGQSWLIVNNSTGVVTVESSGGNTITAMAAGTQITVTCISTSGTTAASWNSSYIESGGLITPGTSGQLAYYAASGSIVSGLTTGTGIITALGVNTGSAGSFVVNGGVLGTPSSGTLTNCTGLPSGAGLTTNSGSSAPSAGQLGQKISAQVLNANAVSLTNGTVVNITSVTLTAGTWAIKGNYYTTASGTNVSAVLGAISTANNTFPDDSLASICSMNGAAISNFGGTVIYPTVSISTSTTYYLNAIANFSTGSCTASGYIEGTRIA